MKADYITAFSGSIPPEVVQSFQEGAGGTESGGFLLALMEVMARQDESARGESRGWPTAGDFSVSAPVLAAVELFFAGNTVNAPVDGGIRTAPSLEMPSPLFTAGEEAAAGFAAGPRRDAAWGGAAEVHRVMFAPRSETTVSALPLETREMTAEGSPGGSRGNRTMGPDPGGHRMQPELQSGRIDVALAGNRSPAARGDHYPGAADLNVEVAVKVREAPLRPHRAEAPPSASVLIDGREGQRVVKIADPVPGLLWEPGKIQSPGGAGETGRTVLAHSSGDGSGEDRGPGPGAHLVYSGGDGSAENQGPGQGAAQGRVDVLVSNITPGKFPQVVMPHVITALRNAAAGQSRVTVIRLALEPENMGEIKIKLSYANGELTAHFFTSSGLTREAVEGSLPQLRQTLAQHNISLGEAAAFVGNEQQGQKGTGFAGTGHERQSGMDGGIIRDRAGDGDNLFLPGVDGGELDLLI